MEICLFVSLHIYNQLDSKSPKVQLMMREWRERESAAQPQARLTVAELGAARCRQTRLLLSSFIPRERYLCAERGSVHVDTDKVSRQTETLGETYVYSFS